MEQTSDFVIRAKLRRRFERVLPTRRTTWRFGPPVACAYDAAPVRVVASAHMHAHAERDGGGRNKNSAAQSPRESVSRQKTNWSRSLTPSWSRSQAGDYKPGPRRLQSDILYMPATCPKQIKQRPVHLLRRRIGITRCGDISRIFRRTETGNDRIRSLTSRVSSPVEIFI